jgi:hypothetical protein
MRRFTVVLVVAPSLALAGCAGAGSARAGERDVVAEGSPMSAPALRRDLAAFADDSMRGRQTGTPDALRAARFLVDRVRALGLEPAGDSLYLQRVPMSRETFTDAAHVEVVGRAGTRSLHIGADLVPLLDLGEGIPPTRRTADGPLVFVGYGLDRAAGGRDDLGGLDLTDKVVVVVNGAPAGADSATRARLEAQTAITDRLARILPQHPAAVIVLLAGSGGRTLYDQLAPSLVRRVTLRGGPPPVAR